MMVGELMTQDFTVESTTMALTKGGHESRIHSPERL